MTIKERIPYPSTQIATPSPSELPVSQIGVAKVRAPIAVWDRYADFQNTVGEFTLTVDMPNSVQRLPMNRFLEALEEHRGNLSQETLPELVDDLRSHLNAERAYARVDFPYFITRVAPVSGASSRLEINAWFEGEARDERHSTLTAGIEIPVMTLNPSSKEISRYGALSQRSYVRIHVQFREMIWLEELAEMADAAASSPIFPILSREDEKWVTEQSYENPVSSDDLVRRVAVQLMDDNRVTWFKIEVESQESVHHHSIYAALCSDDLDDFPSDKD